jgi:membrane-associated protein
MMQVLSYLLHIDSYLLAFATHYGLWTYGLLFAIIFCETGLVVTPFLPGDSLLFAAGTIAANESNALSIHLVFILLTIASFLGNKTNYLFGRLFANRFCQPQDYPRWINQHYLKQAHQFYEKHGGKTIILARFIPIIRTFGPFVAGTCAMNPIRFFFYNAFSAILWIGSLLYASYFFGNLPFVRAHFTSIIYGIIIVSILPPLVAFIYRKLLPVNAN